MIKADFVIEKAPTDVQCCLCAFFDPKKERLTSILGDGMHWDPIEIYLCNLCLMKLQKAIHKHLAAKLFGVEEI